jgi:hypothetical protein
MISFYFPAAPAAPQLRSLLLMQSPRCPVSVDVQLPNAIAIQLIAFRDASNILLDSILGWMSSTRVSEDMIRQEARTTQARKLKP